MKAPVSWIRDYVDLPDDVGESLGWTLVVTEDDGAPELMTARRATPHDGQPPPPR